MTGAGTGRTHLIAGPSGPLELLRTGAGDPVTVFAPGLGESITSTRPFGSGVAGTKVFFHFAGYDDPATGPGGDPDAARADDAAASAWDGLGAQLLAVADHAGATRAVGASLGAVALLTALVAPGRDPGRFDRLVLLLPPAADRVRLGAIADLLGRGDTAGLNRMLLAERPAGERPDARTQAWVRGAVDRIAALGPHLVSALARSAPPLSPERLAAVQVPVLVVAQEDDPAHPVMAADRLAGSLGNATSLTLPGGGLLTAHRAALREAVVGFLHGSLNFEVRAARSAR